jgi:hypothetical protein
LLFEINRTMLHPVGLSLDISDRGISLRDCRNDPTRTVYTKEELEKGTKKYRTFIEREGVRLMEIRRKQLGQASQPTLFL